MPAPLAYILVPSLAHNEAGHSEHNGRVTAIGDALAGVPGIEMALQLPRAAPATAAQVTTAHSARYLAQLKAAAKAVPPRIADPSTYLCSGSVECALEAAGAPTAQRAARPQTIYVVSFAPKAPLLLHSISLPPQKCCKRESTQHRNCTTCQK